MDECVNRRRDRKEEKKERQKDEEESETIGLDCEKIVKIRETKQGRGRDVKGALGWNGTKRNEESVNRAGQGARANPPTPNGRTKGGATICTNERGPCRIQEARREFPRKHSEIVEPSRRSGNVISTKFFLSTNSSFSATRFSLPSANTRMPV